MILSVAEYWFQFEHKIVYGKYDNEHKISLAKNIRIYVEAKLKIQIWHL